MSNGGTVDELASTVRFGKFVSVGAVGAVFDLTVSAVLTVFFGVLAEYAKLVGAEVAIVVMFFINDNWTFAGEGATSRGHTLRRLLKSNLVRSGGLAVQFFIVRGLRLLDLSFVVAGFDLWTVLPFPIAIGASMFFNYVAESLFTWRVGDQ
ncbi:Putative flippase GtrA (transmembrane translocase of bactoprenol-linked glucose) [Halogranum gelatinilyticum]|uniref:Putative flippase GtrA (Transmembrane translocase of bactoprenol-linked glucose) n=1 Tax=Halogranum gelatinilyticum TaxID=660521 RepID=A0A1G9QJY2_9EURY|nr:GtrA family protein [Halogranum gelatinilyticum]SDM11210.1 Putative flippase GtrA (transmembrane translocase of bactoprenol-linked glucose) [Halogranum gelatinilyticum]